jgi:hypothetical protein
MSLAEILPAVRALPREEQLELMRVVSAELASDSPAARDDEAELLARLVRPGATYHIFTPDPCPGAAHELMKLLADPSQETV